MIRVSQLGQSGATDGQVVTWDNAAGEWVPETPAGSSLTVQDENGNVSTAVTQIDFQGAGVTATAGTGEVIVTIGGGSSSVTGLLCIPQGTLARKYTFDTTTESWTTDAGSLSATGGKLRVTGGGSNATALEPSGASSVADGELVVDLQPVTASSAIVDMGVVFRATDVNNHYLLAIRSGAYSSGLPTLTLYKKVSGSYTSLFDTPSTTAGNIPFVLGATGGPLRVLVRFVGNVITVFVNETFVASVTDSSLSTGRVGVRVGGASPAYVLDVDNVLVYTLSSGWTPTPYA